MNLSLIGTLGLLIVVASAGCLDDKVALTQTPRVPVAAVKSPELGPDAFDLTTRYAVSAAGMTMTDMAAVHYSNRPQNITNVSVTISWNSQAGIGSDQDCMVHDGTGQKMGATLATKKGPSPLAIAPITLNSTVASIAVMCGATGEPAGAGANQVVHVVLKWG